MTNRRLLFGDILVSLLLGAVPRPADALQGAIEAEGLTAPAADSTELRNRALTAQSVFERARVSHAPMGWRTFTGPCDDTIGRFCLTFGNDAVEEDDPDAWKPPPEVPEVTEARLGLIETLAEIGEAIPGDGWVLGQRVACLGEAGRWDESLALARRCGAAPAEAWLCRALEGLSLHRLGRFEEAEAAFDSAISGMPEAVAVAWRGLDFLLPEELRPLFAEAPPDSIGTLRKRAWVLADPLYLVPGNDRLTEHFSRWTLARIRSGARNPYSMRWDEDLAELLVRYGPEVAFEHEWAPALNLGPTPVVGRMNPSSRGVFPPPEAFRSVASIPPGNWRTDSRRTPERYSPAYAPRIAALEVQQARFRRGEDLLLVLGWSAKSDQALTSATEWGVFLRAAHDLTPVTPSDWERMPDHAMRGGGGVAAFRTPAGGYLLSVEVLDPEAERAWRARHGVEQSALTRGVVELSDLLLLSPGQESAGIPPTGAAEGHEVLEDVLSRVLPESALAERRVDVAWEVYGLVGSEERLRFHLVAAPEGSTFLERAARFLRLLEPEATVEISWEERMDPATVPAPGDPLFRRVGLDLSALPSGPARLTLSMELPGRSPATSEILLELPR
ncbi:MAG: hypothetical protein WEG36_11320 [Gemmatimonadota bacterium]